MKTLYHFHWDLYYGQAEGLFISTPDEITAALGKQVDLGSAEGKHSEVYGPLEQKDVTVITNDQAFIAQWEIYFPKGMGYNPFDHIE